MWSSVIRSGTPVAEKIRSAFLVFYWISSIGLVTSHAKTFPPRKLNNIFRGSPTSFPFPIKTMFFF